jgi:hypothetical protein
MLVGGIPLFLGGGAPTFAGWALFGFGNGPRCHLRNQYSKQTQV